MDQPLIIKVNIDTKVEENAPKIIMGLSRGKNSFLNYCIIDKYENILEQGTFDEEPSDFNYSKEFKKFISKKTWDIKEKTREDIINGYISKSVGAIGNIWLDYAEMNIVMLIVAEEVVSKTGSLMPLWAYKL